MNQNKIENEKFPELRFLSLNEARKRLGIRRGNLLKLIRDRKPISKIINNKIYVQLLHLKKVGTTMKYYASAEVVSIQAEIENSSVQILPKKIQE